MDDEDISRFSAALRGPVIRADDAGYDDARRLYNAMIDKRPRLIARCADAADVMTAVAFGRDKGLPIAIRGGGHNGAGLGSVDDGLVIDLSAMKGIRVDPRNRTVRVGPGCTTGEVDHATHAFGQAVPFGIISTTGVAGLTLSGGHGYLARQYGLAIDNLIEADVVLADGRFVIAGEDDNADLLWALRGGGGNFGVVTSFLFRTHPADRLYGGPIIFDLSDAETVMRWYRDFLQTASDAFYIFLGLQTVPPSAPFPPEHWGKRMCVLLVSHNGDGAEAAVNAVRAALPTPLIDWAGPIAYPVLQTLFDALCPPGLQWYWKGDFVKSLPDAAIAAHIAHAAQAPSALSLMHLYPIDGAVHAKAQGDTAWGVRDATWSMVIAGVDPDPARAAALRDWARAYWAAVHPFDLEGAYPNFMMDDEGEGRIKASYGANYPHLAALKAKFDPTNLFHVNQNIRPAA
ncbi:FAD-binding oxidoreductase [Gluconacetobacter azotocaptans]|uniref:FAD-binding oxidoreductase n=1 Tax=Gluconacetobacter azotocaptans TaxID=142834 RepID=A0A7W4JTM5_9PROT|nr:FAD-binding oxidoreductase [Gluconacetobacter azotocaptans]MBB2190684.1 FAD-binding oxidoreductase [Gluconacetobacter azotocaptans]GBQ30412.1 FAD/FMN-containing dehydrogenase [Gluconacetobacter azotocaptans DSM 13594]